MPRNMTSYPNLIAVAKTQGDTRSRKARMPRRQKEAVATVRRVVCGRRSRSLIPTAIAKPPLAAIAKVPPSQGASIRWDFTLKAATAI
jgi:hypothetical protein